MKHRRSAILAILIPLRLLWEVPQAPIGLILFILVRLVDRNCTTTFHSGCWCTTSATGLGVSFGLFAFGPSEEYYRSRGRAASAKAAADTMMRHELGHSLQSVLLGPAYLPLVGLPSFIFALLTSRGVLDPASYYSRWPESGADRLAGIVRDGT